MSRARWLLTISVLSGLATPLYAQKPVRGAADRGIVPESETQEVTVAAGRMMLSGPGRQTALRSGVYTSDAGIKLLITDGAIVEMAAPAATLARSKILEAAPRGTPVGRGEACCPGGVATVQIQSLTQMEDGSLRLQGADGYLYAVPEGTYVGERGLGTFVVDGPPLPAVGPTGEKLRQ